MSGYASECDSCDELQYEDDMEEIDNGLYCKDCAEEKKEDMEAEQKELSATDGIPSIRHRCVVCKVDHYERQMVVRLEGWTRIECSHPIEVKLLGYCDLGCALCKTHPQWAARWAPAQRTIGAA